MRVVAIAAGISAGAAPSAAAEPVPIDIEFHYVDGLDQPLAQRPVRLVLAIGDAWQQARAGHSTVTDAAGVVQWTTHAVFPMRRRKLPTNFLSQTFSLPQKVTHLAIALELDYLGHPWLIAASVDRFPDGTSAQLDPLRVWGRDTSGAFTVPAIRRGEAWQLPGIPGVVSTPGHEVVSFRLDPANMGWAARLVVRRHDDPVAR